MTEGSRPMASAGQAMVLICDDNFTIEQVHFEGRDLAPEPGSSLKEWLAPDCGDALEPFLTLARTQAFVFGPSFALRDCTAEGPIFLAVGRTHATGFTVVAAFSAERLHQHCGVVFFGKRTEICSGLLFKQSPLPIILWNLSGRLTDWNPAAQDLLGYSADEVLGLHWTFLVPDDLQSDLSVIFESSTGSPETNVPFVRHTRHKDANNLLLEWFSTPILTDEGRLVGVATFCRDVTEAHQMEDLLLHQWHALEQAPVAIMTTNRNGLIDYVNNRFVEMYGYSQSEALGKPASLVKSGLHSPTFYADLWRTVCNGSIYKSEICNRKRSGVIFWAALVVAPVRNASGEITSFVSTTEDISGRKQMEQLLQKSEDKFKNVFDSMQDGYLHLGIDPVKILLNASAVRSLGYQDAGELLRLNPADLFEHRQDYEAMMQSLFQQGTLENFRVRLRRKAGELAEFEGNLLLQRDSEGRLESIEAIFRDITERVRADEERHARLAAEAANRLKTEFLAMISHEIRTPLNAIIGLTHLVRQSESPRKHADYLSHIHLAGQSLLGIVNDLLDLSKIEAGKLEIENTAVRTDDLLSNVIALMAVKAEAKGLCFRLITDPNLPACLLGDPLRLTQLMVNLTSNAIKFTSAGQVIVKVSSSPLPEAQVRLQITVEDTGSGIAEADMANLFQPFTQADSSISRRYGGTGLGLAICQRLAKLMKGDIWAESEPGKGSTFEFSAPFMVLESAQPWPSGLASMRALVVDSDHSANSWMVACLRDMGIRASCAFSVDEATRRACDEGYSVLLVEHRFIKDETVLQALVSHSGQLIWLVGHTLLEAPTNSLACPYTRSQLLACILSSPKETVEPVCSSDQNKIALPSARLLVVEDNAINQMIIRELLENFGLQVDLAGDGQQALTMLKSVSPCPWSLVLMDLQMPVMDGLTATHLIRNDPTLSALPIIAMTAHVLAEERERCRQVGMDDYVPKPIDPEKLYQVLQLWLGTGIESLVKPEISPESRSVAPILPIAGLDSAAGLRRVAGNAILYQRLLLQFANSQEDKLASLELAVKDGANTHALVLLHAMIGALANLGCVTLSKEACAVQQLLAQDAPEEAKIRVAQFATSFREFIEEVQLQLGSTLKQEPESSQVVSGAELAKALADLKHDLETGSGSAVESLATVYSRIPTQLKKQMLELTRLVEIYDYASALPKLADLTARLI